jgi:hypothetical protein
VVSAMMGGSSTIPGGLQAGEDPTTCTLYWGENCKSGGRECFGKEVHDCLRGSVGYRSMDIVNNITEIDESDQCSLHRIRNQQGGRLSVE